MFFDGHAVAVFDFTADGALTQKPGTAGCIPDTGFGPCVRGMHFHGVRYRPSSDGSYVPGITGPDGDVKFNQS